MFSQGSGPHLSIVNRIPGLIKDEHAPGSCQVDAKRASLGRQEKHLQQSGMSMLMASSNHMYMCRTCRAMCHASAFCAKKSFGLEKKIDTVLPERQAPNVTAARIRYGILAIAYAACHEDVAVLMTRQCSLAHTLVSLPLTRWRGQQNLG